MVSPRAAGGRGTSPRAASRHAALVGLDPVPPLLWTPQAPFPRKTRPRSRGKASSTRRSAGHEGDAFCRRTCSSWGARRDGSPDGQQYSYLWIYLYSSKALVSAQYAGVMRPCLLAQLLRLNHAFVMLQTSPLPSFLLTQRRRRATGRTPVIRAASTAHVHHRRTRGM